MSKIIPIILYYYNRFYTIFYNLIMPKIKYSHNKKIWRRRNGSFTKIYLFLWTGNGVKDLETDVIHLLAKTSNFLLVLNSSINFVIYLSIDTKCAIKTIIIISVFINLLWFHWYLNILRFQAAVVGMFGTCACARVTSSQVSTPRSIS